MRESAFSRIRIKTKMSGIIIGKKQNEWNDNTKGLAEMVKVGALLLPHEGSKQSKSPGYFSKNRYLYLPGLMERFQLECSKPATLIVIFTD